MGSDLMSLCNQDGANLPGVLILAYGNPLRSDDGVGWLAAEALEKKLAPARVEILCLHQLAPELAESVSRAQAVIFVDAAQTVADESAGEVQVRELSSVSRNRAQVAHTSHSISPQGLIDLALRLYGSTPRAFCVTITGTDFGHGECLSPAVAAALPKLIDNIESLVAGFAPNQPQAVKS